MALTQSTFTAQDATGTTQTFSDVQDPANANALAPVHYMGGFSVTPQVSKTRPGNTTSYAVGQVVSEDVATGTAWVFTLCARGNGMTGLLLNALMTDSVL